LSPLLGASPMFDDRLPQIEKLLKSRYRQYNEIEQDIVNNQNPMARAQSRQQLDDLKPEIRRYEEEYLQTLQQEATRLTFDETDAQAVIDVVAKEVTRIESNSSAYPDELLQQVREIRAKLDEPGTSAALKIKPVISLLPPGIGLTIEGDLDIENFLRKNFPTFTRLLQGAKPKK
jgi:predicted  nucleic acid-binding Zn-ribbon protein